MADFREINVIDFDEQVRLKQYIDDLVFCLYFDINLTKSQVSSHKKVITACSNNKYYWSYKYRYNKRACMQYFK